MLAPHDPNRWFDGIPWSHADVNFHDYWQRVQSGEITADCFMRFGSGDASGAHELAHLICCKDEDVLDPYYGCGEIDDPFSDPSLSQTIVEFGVQYVEEMMRLHWEHGRGLWLEHTFPNFWSVWVGVSGSRNSPHGPATGKYLLKKKEQAWHYCQAVKKFRTIDNIWTELVRKRAIVAHALAAL